MSAQCKILYCTDTVRLPEAFRLSLCYFCPAGYHLTHHKHGGIKHFDKNYGRCPRQCHGIMFDFKERQLQISLDKFSALLTASVRCGRCWLQSKAPLNLPSGICSDRTAETTRDHKICHQSAANTPGANIQPGKWRQLTSHLTNVNVRANGTFTGFFSRALGEHVYFRTFCHCILMPYDIYRILNAVCRDR